MGSWVVVLQYGGADEDESLDEALEGTAKSYDGKLEEARFDVKRGIRELQFDFHDRSVAEAFVAHVDARYRVEARLGWNP